MHDLVNTILGEDDGERRLRSDFFEYVLDATERGDKVHGSPQSKLQLALISGDSMMVNLLNRTRDLVEQTEVFDQLVERWRTTNADRIAKVIGQELSLKRPKDKEPIRKLDLPSVLKGSIYDSDTLKNIRERFKDKKVAVIDLDGVLRGYNNPNIPNEHALKALKALQQEDCELILWTAAEELDAVFFEDNDLLDTFSLIITGENANKRFYDEENATDAIHSTPWLSDDEKRILADEFKRFDYVKPMPMLFAHATMVEDSETSLPQYFREDSLRYQFIKTPTFNGDEKDADQQEDQWFNPSHVEKIMAWEKNKT